MASHASTPGTASLASVPKASAVRPSASSRSAASAKVDAERMTPAPRVMIRWTAVRDSAASRGTGAGAGSWSPARSDVRSGVRSWGPAATMSAAMRSAKTRPSRRELDASRFAPCTPVQAVSPQAYRPGTVVRPHRSVRTPPEA